MTGNQHKYHIASGQRVSRHSSRHGVFLFFFHSIFLKRHSGYYLIILPFLFPFNLFAQKPFCGNDFIDKKFIESHLSFSTEENSEKRTSGTVHVIPVVFHILHQNGNENISDAQICDAIAVLNEDFRKKNYDTAYTVNNFLPIAADAEIEFRLARIDPIGNPTNGIDRIFSSLTFNATDASKLNQWPPSQYLNIWTVDSLAPIIGMYGIKGYAYGPAYASVYPQHDGILIRHDCVGRFGSGDIYQPTWARIITHEMGHYLNLLHIWGNSFGVGTTCSGDDFVGDTPQTTGSLWCSNLYLSTCGFLDNVQNYMNYSYCYTMFTQGQVTRMKSTLTSPLAGRNNLWTPTNLALTGTTSYQTCLTSAIDEQINKEESPFVIFPNPSNGNFIVECKNGLKEFNIDVYNVFGQKILQLKKSNQINLTDNGKGIYFVNIYIGRALFSKKIVVE